MGVLGTLLNTYTYGLHTDIMNKWGMGIGRDRQKC